jgi:GYF domain 2
MLLRFFLMRVRVQEVLGEGKRMRDDLEGWAQEKSVINWYIARDGQQYGPLNELEVQKYIELGHLLVTDLLWRDGFQDWRPADEVFTLGKRIPTGS